MDQLQRQRSASTSSMFIPGDEVKWMMVDQSSDHGWVTRIFPADDKAWVVHADGSFVERGFADLHLVSRFPSGARKAAAAMVQTLGDDPNFNCNFDLESADLPSAMKNFIGGVGRAMPMSRELFQEQCQRLIDLQGVYDKIGELEDQIVDLSTPDKNVIWLNQQRRDLEGTIDELNDKISGLQGDKAELEEKVAQVEAMNAKFVGSYKQFLEQKELLVTMSQNLEQQKNDLEHNLGDETHRNNQLTESNAKQMVMIQQLESQNSDLNRELNDTRGLYKEEITRREDLTIKVANLEKTNADLLSQLELLISANRELQQGMREWRIQNQDIFAQLKNLSSRKIPAAGQ